MDSDGQKLEADVELLCSRTYLADFVAKSPQYQKADGQKKEAADLMLMLRDSVLVMQVKTRKQPSQLSMDEIPAQRWQKTIDEGIDQTKVGYGAIRNRTLLPLITGRGIELPLHYDEITKIVGVVLVHAYSEAELPYSQQRVHLPRLHSSYGYPIHVMRFEDFVQIADELSTLPDLIGYLETRGEIFRNCLIPSLTPELDLLGLYVTQYPKLEKAVQSRQSMVIAADVWGQYQKLDEIHDARCALRRRSKIYDSIIDRCHQAIGFSLNAVSDLPQEEDYNDAATAEIYGKIARELSAIGRLTRHYVAAKIVEHMRIAASRGRSFFAITLEDQNAALAFYCSGSERIKRREDMALFLKMQVAGRDLDYGIGISTEPFDSETRSFDFALVSDLSEDYRQELKASWNRMRIKTSRPSGDEWNLVRGD